MKDLEDCKKEEESLVAVKEMEAADDEIEKIADMRADQIERQSWEESQAAWGSKEGGSCQSFSQLEKKEEWGKERCWKKKGREEEEAWGSRAR